MRTKLIIAFCLFGVFPVAAVGGYGALHSFSLLDSAIQDRLQAETTLKADEIQRLLQSVESSVLFLSLNSTLQNLVNVPPQLWEERRRLASRLGEEFLSFSGANGIYLQIRYIDEHGMEIVRANFDGQAMRLVPAEHLQNKRDRYYFAEAMVASPGTVYVSPMDLNIENGVIEEPPKPVVRYAVAVHGRQGQQRGILIVNLDASRILGQILALNWEKADVALASSEGFYFSRLNWIRDNQEPHKSAAFFFPRWRAYQSERPSLRSDAGGRALEKLLAKDFDIKPSADVRWKRPGVVVGPGLQGRVVAFAPVFPSRERRGEFWVLLYSYSKGETLSSIQSLQAVVLMLGALVIVVAFGFGVAAARSITHPIAELTRGAEAVVRGDFDRPVLVQTGDEIENLSHQFTRMTARLKEREQEVREARERAEHKAQEAQVLCRIGTEILAVLSLPRILQLVVDKVREIMKGDLVILCLHEPDNGLRVGATSGPSELISLLPGEPVGRAECLKLTCPEADCPVTHAIRVPTQIAIPLLSGERVAGNLCVGYRVLHQMDQDEREFLKGLANLAVVAMENARLHRQVQHMAALKERERIAADLHDGIIQSIYGTGLKLFECMQLAEENPGEMKRRVAETIEDLNTAIQDIRNYIVGLQSEDLQEGELSHSLTDLVRRMALNTRLEAEIKVEPAVDGLLTEEQTWHLFQICRESLTNVVKHARASTVVLTLGTVDGNLRLSVEDDGIGFDSAHRSPVGHGLRNIEERIRRLGGALLIESVAGCGTRISVECPVKDAA